MKINVPTGSYFCNDNSSRIVHRSHAFGIDFSPQLTRRTFKESGNPTYSASDPMPRSIRLITEAKRIGSAAFSFRRSIEKSRCLLRSPRYAVYPSNTQRTLTNTRHKRIAQPTERCLRQVENLLRTVSTYRTILHYVHDVMQLSERIQRSYVLTLRRGGGR